MKNLLILSPRFAPVSCADNQRVLQMIPHLAASGWKIHVASVDCGDLGLTEDAALSAALGPHCEWRTARPLPLGLTKPFGLRSLAIRSRRALDRLVREWHREVHFDLLFVSNTEFALWPLAWRWKLRFGLPYVLDWQDPWLSDYYRQRPQIRPPGGALKFGISQWIARRWEPRVALAAAAHVCVSSRYIRMLCERYPQLRADTFTTLPFASAITASTEAAAEGIERYWVYVGRGGDDMAFSLTALFSALAAARKREPSRLAGLKLRFVGTSYADAARALPTIAPIAKSCGVADMVEESTQRVPPDEVRRLYRDAEAIIVPGSDDAGYVASKIQSCLAMHKPLLAIFHAESDVVAVLKDQPGVVACVFSETDSDEAMALAARIDATWMQRDVAAFDCSGRQLSDYSAEAMTRQLNTVFQRVLA